jgi:DNA-3-methyladenine glycosylase
VLPRSFYRRRATEVAPELVGMLFVRRLDGEALVGRIVETEAYMGPEDPASHAYRGMTKRNRTMFGHPGHLYVYRSYGIHYCANVVTGDEGIGTAVLIRALEPLEGTEVMERLRGMNDMRLLCSGPGRVCQALGITTDQDATDLLGDDIFITGPRRRVPMAATPRVGITIAQGRLWRFVETGSRFASRKA